MSQNDWVDDPAIDDGDWVDDDAPSLAESGVRGFTQGAAFGLTDELSGGLEAAGRIVGLKGLGKDFGNQSFETPVGFDTDELGQIYEQQRDEYRGKLKKDSDVNPVVSTVGNLAGAVASPFNKIGKGLSFAKQGAILGGVGGFGMSEGEDLGDIALDTGKGVALGAGLGKVVDTAAPLVSAGIKKVGEGSKTIANRLAAKALGAERGTIKKLGADKVEEIGRYALDEGIISPLASADDMIARNTAKMSQGGQMMDDTYRAIDDAGASSFNPLDVASKVDEQIGGFYRSPINRGETNQLENTLESILMRGDKNISLREAQALKQELGKVANWKNNLNITDKERMARQAYGVVSGAIDDAAAKGASSIGKEGLEETLAQGKQLYAKGSGAETLLENKLAREQGNKFFSLTDSPLYAGGIGGAPFTGGMSLIPAAGAVLAKKGLEKYGPQSGALAFDKISKALLKSPQMQNLSRTNPKLFQTMVQQLEQRTGLIEQSPMNLPRAADDDKGASIDKESIMQKTQGSKYHQALQNAASKNDNSFAAAHYVLANQDEEYRKLTGQ